MERSCLVVVQHKHSIRKLSSWHGVFEWTVLILKVRCKMSTLKPAAENSLCQLSSLSKSSDVSVLFCCFSWRFFFSAGHLSNLSFHDLLFHREDNRAIKAKLSTTPSPRSSRPKSKDFLAFVGPWPPVSQVPYRTLYFTSNP